MRDLRRQPHGVVERRLPTAKPILSRTVRMARGGEGERVAIDALAGEIMLRRQTSAKPAAIGRLRKRDLHFAAGWIMAGESVSQPNFTLPAPSSPVSPR